MGMTATLCLASAIYHESRGEPEPGQFAVAEVIMRRVEDNRWPNDVCSVVYQRHQFEWAKSPPPITETRAWEKAGKIADIVLERPTTATRCADHFTHVSIAPPWAASMKVEKVIGGHVFYCSKPGYD